jgi:hypothetical protein
MFGPMNWSVLLAKAATQGGFVTRRQLLESGYGASWVRRAIQRGELIPVVDGVYRAVPIEGEDALLRGAILALPRAAVSHFSAARVWGFPYLSKGPVTVSVHHRTTHVFPEVEVRRTIDLEDHHLAVERGLLVTTPARTIVDLAANLNIRHLDRVLDGVLVSRLATYEEVATVALEVGRRGRPGTVKLRNVLSIRGDGHMATATQLERLGHSVLRRYGVPEPIPQYPIPWDQDRRFDGAYPPERFALEWDSRRYHMALQQMAEDRARDRECAIHDWGMMRFTWHDLKQRPEMVARQVAAMLELRRNRR